MTQTTTTASQREAIFIDLLVQIPACDMERVAAAFEAIAAAARPCTARHTLAAA